MVLCSKAPLVSSGKLLCAHIPHYVNDSPSLRINILKAVKQREKDGEKLRDAGAKTVERSHVSY